MGSDSFLWSPSIQLLPDSPCSPSVQPIPPWCGYKEAMGDRDYGESLAEAEESYIHYLLSPADGSLAPL